MATLIINISDSYCGACGKGCNPHEKTHKTIYGYGGPHPPGCGAEYTEVSTNYMMDTLFEAIKKMRPDLPFVSPWDRIEV